MRLPCMTIRGLLFFLSGILLASLSAALSARVLACLSAVIGLVLVYGFLSVWLSRKTTRLFATVEESQVLRGEQNALRLKAVRKSFLPAGGVTVRWRDGESAKENVLWPSLRKAAQTSLPLNTAHVGTFELQVESVRWDDLYGLFSLRKKGFKPAATYCAACHR